MNVMVWPTIVLLAASFVSFAASFALNDERRQERFWLVSMCLAWLSAVSGTVGLMTGG